jgi:DNA-binding response OmpR family regulator
MQNILVIDDDESIRETIAVMLERESFTPLLAADGKTGHELTLKRKPDLILVDLRLPEMSGLEVCRAIRSVNINTPIIVLSAIGDEIDKVLLLEVGADDYVVKPFGTRELLARIRALLRRAHGDQSAIVKFGDIEVHLDRKTVLLAGNEIRMTPAEYNLLSFFVRSPERTLSREAILTTVWGYESLPNTRTVDAHVVRLRQKLEPDPTKPRFFCTIHGFGYRFNPKA